MLEGPLLLTLEEGSAPALKKTSRGAVFSCCGDASSCRAVVWAKTSAGGPSCGEQCRAVQKGRVRGTWVGGWARDAVVASCSQHRAGLCQCLQYSRPSRSTACPSSRQIWGMWLWRHGPTAICWFFPRSAIQTSQSTSSTAIDNFLYYPSIFTLINHCKNDINFSSCWCRRAL